MRKVYFIAFFFIPVSLTIVAYLILRSRTPYAERISGWVHTNGTALVDSNNNTVVIKAINYNELTPVGYVYKKPDLEGLPDVCKRWVSPPQPLDVNNVHKYGFNTVRLVLNWDQIENSPPVRKSDGSWRHKWNDNYLKAIDETITQLGRKKIAVILDLHQYLWSSAFKYIQSEDGSGCAGGGMPAWLYPEPEMTTFQKARCNFFGGKTYIEGNINAQDAFGEVWNMIARRYQDNPAVIAADIINEPWAVKGICSPKDLNLDAFYRKIGGIIREANPNLLLIFEDSQDYGDSVFSITGPLPFDNTVYSFHLYTGDWNNSGKERLLRYFNRSQKWQIPLFVGEFDAFGYSVNIDQGGRTDWQNETEEMLKFFKENKIHWAFWSYSGYESLVDPKFNRAKTELLDILRKGF